MVLTFGGGGGGGSYKGMYVPMEGTLLTHATCDFKTHTSYSLGI